MNRFGLNLIFAVLFLIVAVLASIVLLVAVGVFDPSQLSVAGWTVGERPLSYVDAAGPLARLLWAVGALVLGVLAVWALWGRLGGGAGAGPEAHSRYLLVADEQGFVLVETESVAIVAKQATYQIKGVVDASVRVLAAGGSAVRIGVDLVCHPGADVKGAGASVKDGVREAVERLVGLDVQDVMVNVRVAEPDELARILS